MKINERISKIEEYFSQMRIITVEGKRVMYVIVNFPYTWNIIDDIEEKFNVSVINSKEKVGEYFFCGDIENGEYVVFDAIEYCIDKIKESIERKKLLELKIKELTELFSNEDITLQQLKTLQISYNDIPQLPKKKNKPELKSEASTTPTSNEDIKVETTVS